VKGDRMAGRDEPTDEIEFEESPILPNINQSVIVYALPQYYSNTSAARRSDPGVPREKIGSLNNTEDLTGTVRKLATTPGAYLAELRLDGRVAESKVIELKPRSEIVQTDYSNGQYGEPPARAQNGRASLPAEVEARLSRIEGALLVIAEREKDEKESVPMRKPVDELRDTLELVREFQSVVSETVKEVVKQTPAQTPTTKTNGVEGDPDERAILLLLKDTELRSRTIASLRGMLNGEQEPSKAGWLDVLGRVLELRPTLVDRAFKIVERLVPGGNSGATMDDEGEDDNDGDDGGLSQLNEFIERTGGDAMMIVSELTPDLILNRAVGRALVLIHAFVRRYPAQGAIFSTMQSMKPEELLNMLASKVENGEELKKLAHAQEWLAGLQRALAGSDS
jgi:hypothetical protein